MKPEVWNSRERFTAAEWTDRVLFGFVYHAKIKYNAYNDLNCTTDGFQNSQKMQNFHFFQRGVKICCISFKCLVFFSQLDQFVNTCTSI